MELDYGNFDADGGAAERLRVRARVADGGAVFTLVLSTLRAPQAREGWAPAMGHLPIFDEPASAFLLQLQGDRSELKASINEQLRAAKLSVVP